VHIGASAGQCRLREVDVENRDVSGFVPLTRDLEYLRRYAFGAGGQSQAFLSLKSSKKRRRNSSQRLSYRVLGIGHARGELGASDPDARGSPSADIQLLDDADINLLAVLSRAASAGCGVHLGILSKQKRCCPQTRTCLLDASPRRQDRWGSVARSQERLFEGQRVLGRADARSGERERGHEYHFAENPHLFSSSKP
jgi:hypothetical protein